MKDVIEIDVELATNVRTSWAMLTEAQHLRSWFGSHVSLDPRLGGPFVETWEHEGRVVVTSGVVDELIPHERIGWTWKDDDWPAATHLQLTLAARGDGTRLTLTHSGWEAINAAMGRDVGSEHQSGWRKHLQRLADHARDAAASGVEGRLTDPRASVERQTTTIPGNRSDPMSNDSFTGGCACGAVRYEATGEPVAELHCQCQHCRMRSGTGHSSYIVFAGTDAVTVSGEARSWRIAGDSGNEKIHAFCATCGTPLLLTFAANPEITAIHPGSLDAPARFRPTLVTYRSRALDWDRHDPNLTALEEGPPA